jgi:tryptophan-rich sensory protein
MNIHTAHANHINEELTKDHSEKEWELLFLYHAEAIRNFQHERLIHLLVTLCIGIALIVTVLFMIAFNLFLLYPIVVLLFVLFLPYIVHYFRLENGTQSLYPLAEKILQKLLHEKS